MKKIMIIAIWITGVFGYAEVVTNFYADFTGLTTSSLDETTINGATDLGTWKVIDQLNSSATDGQIVLDKGAYNYRATLDQDAIIDLTTHTVRISFDVRSCRTAASVGGKGNNFKFFDGNFGQLGSFEYSTIAEYGAVEVDMGTTTNLVSSSLAVAAAADTPPADYEHFELVLSETGYDLWINGVEVSSDIAFASTMTEASLMQFRLVGENNSGAWYDNFVITSESIPEPAAIGLWGLSSLFFLILRRYRSR